MMLTHENKTAENRATIIVGVTGASGMCYALRLMEVLASLDGVDMRVVVTQNGAKIMGYETGRGIEYLKNLGGKIHDNNNLSVDVASGSFPFHAMVVVPASMNTTSKIAYGIEDNLVTRIAAVALKEKRILVVVPRETPISSIHLEAMFRLSKAGAVVLPASPGFYNKPKTLDDLVDNVVGRILDHIRLEEKGIVFSKPGGRWKGERIEERLNE